MFSLYPHQQKALETLTDIYQTRHKTAWLPDYGHVTCRPVRIYTNCALLYDPPGTGKMVTALAWCAQTAPTRTIKVVQTGRFYQDVVAQDCPSGTLIVCRPAKFKQWVKSASLIGEVCAVSKLSDFTKTNLVVCKLLDGLFDTLQGTQWARIVYDDCDVWPVDLSRWSNILPTADFTLLIGTSTKLPRVYAADPYLVEYFSVHTEDPILPEKRELYYHPAYANTAHRAEVALMGSASLLAELAGDACQRTADALGLCCWQPAQLWVKLSIVAATALTRATPECQVCLQDIHDVPAVVMSCCGCLLCPVCAVQANRMSAKRNLCGFCAHCKAECTLLDLNYVPSGDIMSPWREPPRTALAQLHILMSTLPGRVHIDGVTTTRADHKVDHLVLVGNACRTWQKSKVLSAVYRIGRTSVLTIHYVWPT